MELYSRVYWKMGEWLTLDARYSIGKGHPKIETLYGGYVMSNYRTLSAYDANLWRRQWQFAGLELSYKNTLSMFFASLSASYSRNDPHILYGYTMNGILSNVITKQTDRYSENTSLKAYLSKGFFSTDMLVTDWIA